MARRKRRPIIIWGSAKVRNIILYSKLSFYSSYHLPRLGPETVVTRKKAFALLKQAFVIGKQIKPLLTSCAPATPSLARAFLYFKKGLAGQSVQILGYFEIGRAWKGGHKVRTKAVDIKAWASLKPRTAVVWLAKPKGVNGRRLLHWATQLLNWLCKVASFRNPCEYECSVERPRVVSPNLPGR